MATFPALNNNSTSAMDASYAASKDGPEGGDADAVIAATQLLPSDMDAPCAAPIAQRAEQDGQALLGDARHFVRIDNYLASYVYNTVSAAVWVQVMTRVYEMYHLLIPPTTPQNPIPVFRFPGSMPRSLMRRNMGTAAQPVQGAVRVQRGKRQVFLVDELMVSMKTNGTRCLLVLLKINGECMTFLVNRRLRMLLLPGVGQQKVRVDADSPLAGTIDQTALYNGTLLDGDVVRQIGTHQYLFVPHDLICTRGEVDLTRTPYVERVTILDKFLQEKRLRCSSRAPLQLRGKPILPAHRTRWLIEKFIRASDIPSDGLNFTRKAAIVETGTSQDTLKHKDFVEHTSELRPEVEIMAPMPGAGSSSSSSSLRAAPECRPIPLHQWPLGKPLDPRDVVLNLTMSGGPDRAKQPITVPVRIAQQSAVDTFGRALSAKHQIFPKRAAATTSTIAFLQETEHTVLWKDASAQVPTEAVQQDALQAYLRLVHQAVCEFYFNPLTSTYHFRCLREDKDYPNTYPVIVATQQNVRENISLNELFCWTDADNVAV
jgi:hypothetical protein